MKLITEQQEPMQLRELHETLTRIERFDPIFALARELHAAGVTEEQLARKLGARSASPIGNALQNCFRDVDRGHTINRLGYEQ